MKKMKNNILVILQSKDISIKKMSEDIELDYATVHRIVKRKDLSSTSIGRLKLIADYLKVNIVDLYCDDYIDYSNFYNQDILDTGLSLDDMGSCFCFLIGYLRGSFASGNVSNHISYALSSSIENAKE